MANPSAYREAVARARVLEGRLQVQAARRVQAELRRYASELSAILRATPAHPNRAAIEATIAAQRSAARALERRVTRAIAESRDLAFEEISGVWQSTQVRALEAAGVTGAALGAVRSPPITLLNAYESIGGAATWRTLATAHIANAAREADLIVRAALNSGVSPDVLAMRLRPYVEGVETLERSFGPLRDRIDLTQLRSTDPAVRGALRRVRYNATRIAVTTAHDARREAELTQFAVDPYVDAVIWELSPDRGTQEGPDECDVLANSNFFGLGDGVYPLDNVPEPPHPHDRCETVPRVSDRPVGEKPTGAFGRTGDAEVGRRVSQEEADRLGARAEELIQSRRVAADVQELSSITAPTSMIGPPLPLGGARVQPITSTSYRTIGDLGDDIATRIGVTESPSIVYSSSLADANRVNGFYDPRVNGVGVSRRQSEQLVRFMQGERDAQAVDGVRSLTHELLHTRSAIMADGGAGMGEWWPFLEEGMVERQARRYAIDLAGVSDDAVRFSNYAREVAAVDWYGTTFGEAAIEELWATATAEARTALANERIRPWLQRELAAKLGDDVARAIVNELGDDAWHVMRVGLAERIPTMHPNQLRLILREDFGLKAASRSSTARVAADRPEKALAGKEAEREMVRIHYPSGEILDDVADKNIIARKVRNLGQETTSLGSASEAAINRAFDNYVGIHGRSVDLNVWLRTGKLIEGSAPVKRLQSIMRDLDRVLKNAPRTRRPMTVYRGGRIGIDETKLKPGVRFTDKGFTSTSFEKKTANSFRQRGEWSWEIHIPAGSRGVHVESIYDIANRQTFVRNEHHYLLPRGSKFRVVSVDKAQRRGVLELIP